MTSAGSGASLKPLAADATREAIARAMATLGAAPRLGWLFCSPKHDLAAVMTAAQTSASGCEFFATHTAGEFTERGAMRGGVVVFLLASDSFLTQTAVARNLSDNPDAAAAQLTREFATLANQASTKGLGLSTSVLLLDAMTGMGEELVAGIRSRTRLFQQIVGGAAGDDGQFKSTPVAAAGLVGVDSAVVAHIFDKSSWGIGVDHGLRPASKRMTVTKASGSVVAKIDNRPAFELYTEYAKSKGIELTRANAGAFMVAHELGVYFLDSIHHARAAVGVGENGELHLISGITQGATICLVDAEPTALIEACGRAAAQARANVGAGPVAGVLVFDSVCRGMILGRDFQKEIDAVRAVFPGVPVAGFLGYGEIARFRGRNEGWHNTTSVVLAIPA